jgi:chromosome segregation ATPase
MENRLKEIKDKIERVLLKYTDLLQDHNSLLLENQSIKTQHEEFKLQNQQVLEQNSELTEKVNELNIRLNELSNDNLELQSQLQQLRLENTTSKGLAGVKQSELDLFSTQESQMAQNSYDLLEQIESLENKISGLKGDNDILRMNLSRKDAFILQLESEKRLLKIKISDLEEEIALKENTIEIQKNTLNDLKEQNKLIKLAKEMSPDKNDNHELKIKINELVRDIDRCIDLLND